MHIIGDVAGKTAIIIDDIIDTAGTIVLAAEALRLVGRKYFADLHSSCFPAWR